MENTTYRHLFLTIWLSLIIIINLLGVVAYILLGTDVQKASPSFPMWAIWVMMGLMLVNVVCALALFKWKKWGFWVICVTAIIAAVINLSFSNVNPLLSILSPVFSILILFWALNAGKEKKAWTRLR